MHDPTRQQRWLFYAILILAVGLRLYGIGGSCFWLDEFCSVECSTGRGLAHVALPRDQWLTDQPRLTTLNDAPPFWRVWTSLRLDNHPPLYFLLLRLWRDMLGESDVAARLLSVFISLAGICFFYDAVRLGLGSSTALWAALLAAVAMPQIHYAQEARGYVLLATLGMAACAAIMRIEIFGLTRGRIVALGLSVLAMLLTHYFAIAALAALGIYAIIALRGHQRRTVMATLIAAVFLFALLWGPWMFQQRHSFAVNNAWQAQNNSATPRHALEQSIILPPRWCSEIVTRWPIPLTMILGLAAYALAVARFRGRRRLWVLWMFLPAIMVTLIDLLHNTRMLDSIRYTVAGSLGLYVLLCGLGKSWRGHWLAAAVAAFCLATAPYDYSRSQDAAQLAAFLQTHVSPDDAVVFASAGEDDWYAGAMYLGVSHYADPLPAPMMLLTKPPTDATMQTLRRRHVVWLIAGSSIPSQEILPGLTPLDSAVFPDIGKVWELGTK